MANHGYLPRNGRASISQLISGTNTVFGMAEVSILHPFVRPLADSEFAQDLGGFLAVYGAIVDGDGQGWSIGGVPHTGISGSHNNYETDSSPLKSDLDQYGSNQRLIMSQFKTVRSSFRTVYSHNY